MKTKNIDLHKLSKLKMSVFIAAAAIFVSIPVSIARAESNISFDQGIAGIAEILDKYHEKGINGEQEDGNNESIVNILNESIISPYANLGVSKADNYVNIRKEPSTDSEVAGKLYRGCATDILEWLDDGWVKIESGDVKGYIAVDYLATGDEAEGMFDEYATRYATVVNTPTLRVRDEASTESSTIELIPEGETFIVTKEHEEWVEILLGSEADGQEFTGFIHKDYTELDIEFNYAISIEEEERIRREQEEAERAEQERLRRLAEEEAERKEAQRRAEQKAAEEKKKTESSKSNNNPPPSSTGSGTGAEIAQYAQKFVGNPYAWGKTSLTNGADCSGFVWRVYQQFGYNFPRTSSATMANSVGVVVNLLDRRPGDLLFYTGSNGRVNHVAMYIGNDRIVHAANSRLGIITQNYNYRSVYRVRRVVN